MGTKDKESDTKVHGTNMGPTWVLSAPGGPHGGPINFAIGADCGDSNVATLFMLNSIVYGSIYNLCSLFISSLM